MNDLTRVYELLESAKQAEHESKAWFQKGLEHTKKAQDLCTHPAFKRKYYTDEFGSLDKSHYSDTCLVCGKDVTQYSVKV